MEPLIIIFSLVIAFTLGALLFTRPGNEIGSMVLDQWKWLTSSEAIGYFDPYKDYEPFIPQYCPADEFKFKPVEVDRLDMLREGEGTYIIPWKVNAHGIDVSFSSKSGVIRHDGRYIELPGGLRPSGTQCMPIRMKGGYLEVNLNFNYFNGEYEWTEYDQEIIDFIQDNQAIVSNYTTQPI